MSKKGFPDLAIIALMFALVTAGGLLASGKIDSSMARIAWMIDWVTR